MRNQTALLQKFSPINLNKTIVQGVGYFYPLVRACFGGSLYALMKSNWSLSLIKKNAQCVLPAPASCLIDSLTRDHFILHLSCFSTSCIVHLLLGDVTTLMLTVLSPINNKSKCWNEVSPLSNVSQLARSPNLEENSVPTHHYEISFPTRWEKQLVLKTTT